jgi:plasmid stabilization system protein ParE
MPARDDPSFSRRAARKLRSIADHTSEIADDLRELVNFGPRQTALADQRLGADHVMRAG